MPTFNADSIIDKSLIAKTTMNVYSRPTVKSNVLGFVKPGQLIGVVYSYIVNSEGLFWMFYDAKKMPYYVKHKEGIFSISSLRDQGVLTTKEKEEQKKQENLSLGDKLGNVFLSFSNILKWVLIAAIIGLLLYYAYESGMFKKILKK